MQYKVPQNIDKPDQIVGPLTLVEFSYLAIAGALDVLIFQTIKGTFAILLIGIISIIALAFAFLKIQDRPLLYFISNAILFATNPKTRIWLKVSDSPVLKASTAPVKVDTLPAKKGFDPSQISKLSQTLDSRGPAKTEQPPAQVFKNIKPDTVK